MAAEAPQQQGAESPAVARLRRNADLDKSMALAIQDFSTKYSGLDQQDLEYIIIGLMKIMPLADANLLLDRIKFERLRPS